MANEPFWNAERIIALLERDIAGDDRYLRYSVEQLIYIHRIWHQAKRGRPRIGEPRTPHEPWKAAGMSQRTWYRRQAEQRAKT